MRPLLNELSLESCSLGPCFTRSLSNTAATFPPLRQSLLSRVYRNIGNLYEGFKLSLRQFVTLRPHAVRGASKRSRRRPQRVNQNEEAAVPEIKTVSSTS